MSARVSRNAAWQANDDQHRTAIDKFTKSILVGPFNPCYCCSRLCYDNGGSYVCASDSLLLPIHDRESSGLVRSHDESVWLCSRCKRSLRSKHKLPSFALVNNMHVPQSPQELTCLNNMEKRLISRVQPFMKLVVLPYGQRALQGQTINFPVNMSEVCSSLPKPLDNAGIILIALPRTESSSVVTAAPVLYSS